MTAKPTEGGGRRRGEAETRQGQTGGGRRRRAPVCACVCVILTCGCDTIITMVLHHKDPAGVARQETQWFGSRASSRPGVSGARCFHVVGIPPPATASRRRFREKSERRVRSDAFHLESFTSCF